ncbi:MAG TPA: hypothetical protein VF599_01080 [Pyrinomonadaceae bacterium]|jgi:hypothetical protein
MNSSHYSCEKCFDLIEDLVEGELDRQIAGQINSHVFACPKCQNEYETRLREKEIYAHYLFDAEPPPDSWTDFQTRLAAEKEKTSDYGSMPVGSARRRTNIFGFLRLPAPLTASVALLLLAGGGIGFVWLKSAPVEQAGDKYIAEEALEDSRLPPPSEIELQRAADLQMKTVDGANDGAPKNDETPLPVRNQSFKAIDNSSAGKKSFAAATLKIKQKSIPANAETKPARDPLPNREERRLALRMKNLENEIAAQIEKVELLLRSFRNARANEAVEIFDVEYEKRQARKLLETNARLRRDAEDYGISYAEELLSRIEPYLLDIANLEANPAPDKVQDIKQRVNNQNIIASLQVYSRDAAQ